MKGNKMKSILNIINKIECVVMIVGTAFMLLISFCNVVFRRISFISMTFTEELVVLLFFWVTMFGIGYAYQEQSHTNLNIMTNVVPKPFKIIINIFSMCCTLIFMSVVALTGCTMVGNALEFDRILPSLGISQAWQSIALPIGAAVIMLTIILDTIVRIKEILASEDK